MRLKAGAAALLCLLAVAARPAAAATDCDNAQDQMTLNQCAGEDFTRADAKLNSTYGALMARLKASPDQAKLLVTAQRAWLAFRDADCSFQGSGVAGGSIYPMIVTICRTSLTDQRIKTFDSWLHCQEGDMSCPVH